MPAACARTNSVQLGPLRRGAGRSRCRAIAHYRRRLADIFGDEVDGFHALDAATEHHHPCGWAHHYLQHLAVHPDHQGRGLGSRLLTHHHTLLDEQGLPAYLEATGARTQDLYRRHGYHQYAEFALGAQAPVLYPMWRPPAPTLANPHRAGTPSPAGRRSPGSGS
jgi:ribosomal protein S18 acetylase RimI-like enzyme